MPDVRRDSAAVRSPGHEAGSPLFTVGDIHGHIPALRTALRRAGLITTAGDWCGGRARLWFLGDLVDRGPDGLATIDFVQRLELQASEGRGQVNCLLGNHEVLLLAARYFGNTSAAAIGRGFLDHWLLNGGRADDFTGITAYPGSGSVPPSRWSMTTSCCTPTPPPTSTTATPSMTSTARSMPSSPGEMPTSGGRCFDG
jgi:Calcineurin-like phosphoesterase